MRIVLLPSAFHPGVGGVEVLSARLGATLVTRGHDVEVWTYDQPDAPQVEQVDGLTVRRFPFPMPSSNLSALLRLPGTAFATLLSMRSEVRRFRPDVLHVQCFSGNGAYATVLAAAMRVPLVVSLQGETVMDDRKIYDHSTSLRAALRVGGGRASVVTACSQFTLDDAVARVGMRSAESVVVFNGVDLETEIANVGLPTGRRIFAVGRVVENKGFDLLIKAFTEVRRRHEDVVLVIAGDGPELGRLRAQALDLGVGSSVVFLGRLTQAEVAGAMLESDVLVVPSRVEPFGIVTLEGWRAGVPVVVTNRGGAPEFVRNGIDGLTIDPFSTNELERAIERILSDEGFAQQMVRAAKLRLPAFSWDAIADQYLALYDKVTARS